jgi:hypothetical protein
MHQGVAPFATDQTVTHTAVANLRLYLSHDRSGLLPTVEAFRNQTYAMRMRFEARWAGVLERGPWQARVRLLRLLRAQLTAPSGLALPMGETEPRGKDRHCLGGVGGRSLPPPRPPISLRLTTQAERLEL